MLSPQYNSLFLHNLCRALVAGITLLSALVLVSTALGNDTPPARPSVLQVFCSQSSYDNAPILQLRDANFSVHSSDPALEFIVDVLHDKSPDLFVEFVHCDPSWERTKSNFINTGMLSMPIAPFIRKQDIMQKPSWEGRIVLPNPHLRFEYSGNYLMVIKDSQDPSTVLATTRVLVTENTVKADIEVQEGYGNASLPNTNVQIFVNKPGVFVPTAAVLYPLGNLSTGYSVSDRQLGCDSCGIISSNEFSVYGRNMPFTTFSFRGIQTLPRPRLLDASNTFQFPRGTIGYLRRPDRPRAQSFIELGPTISEVNGHGESFSNYAFIQLEFESSLLDMDVFVVGSHNHWTPTVQDKMLYDVDQDVYKIRRWFRRGKHGYCYVLGTTRTDGSVEVHSIPEAEVDFKTPNLSYIGCIYTYTQSNGGYYTLSAISLSNE